MQVPLENDDELRGHVLSRREAVVLLGAGGLVYLTGCAGGSAGSAPAEANAAAKNIAGK